MWVLWLVAARHGVHVGVVACCGQVRGSCGCCGLLRPGTWFMWVLWLVAARHGVHVGVMAC